MAKALANQPPAVAEPSLPTADLPVEDRTLLELVAAFDGTAPISSLTQALGKSGVREHRRAWKNAEVRLALERLAERGWLASVDRLTVHPPLIHRILDGSARAGRLVRVVDLVRHVRPGTRDDGRFRSWEDGVRDVRLALHAKAWNDVRDHMQQLPRGALAAATTPLVLPWIDALPADLRSSALAAHVDTATAELQPADAIVAALAASRALSASERRVLVERYLLAGRFEDAERELAAGDSVESDVSRAWLSLLRGHASEAIAGYERALKRFLKECGARARYFPDRAGLFFPIALLAEGSAASHARALELVATVRAAPGHFASSTFELFADYIEVARGRRDASDSLHLSGLIPRAQNDHVELLLFGAVCRWSNAELPASLVAELTSRRAGAREAGLAWYEAQAADLLGLPSDPAMSFGGTRLRALVAKRERWSETLDALRALVTPKRGSDKAASTSTAAPRTHRLAWIVRKTQWGMSVEPREQVATKGAWSVGKPVALKRLFGGAAALPYVTTADRAACAAVSSSTSYDYGRYARVDYHLDDARALLALSGEDNVLIQRKDGSFAPCEIRRTTPRLVVRRKGERLELALEPRPRGASETRHATVTESGAVEIVEFAAIHHTIADALGPKGLSLPRAAEGELKAVLDELSARVEVHAELAASASASVLRGDSAPVFVLRSIGDALSISAVVRPLGAGGPTVSAGCGGATVIATLPSGPASATRALDEETQRLAAALERCPSLTRHQRGATEFLVEARDDALDALVELHALRASAAGVALEWPDGEALRVSEPVAPDALRASVSTRANGFVAELSIALPDRKSPTTAELLDYLSASPGRFLRLAGDERYVALTTELRSRLDEILAVTSRAGQRLGIPALAAPLFAELVEPGHVEADAGWARHLSRFAPGGADPDVPSTLRAELRPYQIDGFRWLARLARWGAGGVLADDMGLGKTVQTIALLLHRAADGPALVVAPTSVVANWIDELARFAPTLEAVPHLGRARASALDGLGPFKVVVTSYSVLVVDAAALAKVPFATVVLDEAQMIKNATTERARAALALRGDMRLATTGTPIENRLEDLHSLLGFVNPGLLGSAATFAARFVRPASERASASATRDHLRRLVAPFILRRTKTDVLPELPARTEATLRIPLEPEELALYEVVREHILAGLRPSKRRGDRRMQLLAGITRLRLAASNARLIDPGQTARSAKLTALGDLLDELLPNHHKLLVFSQFVGHLALVRELLEERGIAFQYLDGSTPAAARKTAIDRFQAGAGDVFLISLKAGGFGLNLTAADYVVHMDPWWNPAVEDQASDRAHRLGQTRPVTIYRLVARDTIEDRILALHHRKRDLADSVLEGSDLVGRMSEEDLADLIATG